MDLLKGNIKKTYFKYWGAAFGSALISTIYTFVDMIAVGQYEGPNGTAALAIVMPVWTIFFGLGLLFGIGGSVFFSMIRGSAEKTEDENSYFTAAVIATIILSVICTVAFMFWDEEILILFGARDEILTLALRYLYPIKFVIPTFLFAQVFAAFLRNDGNPMLATVAALSGGIFNIFGDFFFTFTLDMGMFGAGLATGIGNALSVLIMLTHFFRKTNTLRFVKVSGIFKKWKQIISTGFSTFFLDIAMGIIAVFINNQIMRYAGTDALAVYGVIINISTMTQSCSYSIGQASQPIISINYGAKQWGRIKKLLRYAGLYSTFSLAIVCTGISVLFPTAMIKLFMDATPGVLAIAPGIIRVYALSFLLLPFNVFSTYYFQSLLKHKTALGISFARGFVVSGTLIFLLPMVFGTDGLWFAMPVTELIIAVGVAYFMRKYTKELGGQIR